MFKNATIFKFEADPGVDTRACLQNFTFVSCSQTQDYSIGFVPPRGEAHGDLLETVGRNAIAKVMIETKTVPGSEIRKKAQEAADHIEATTGRKPGRKETKELREDARMALLPNAFARQRAVWIWFDRVNSLIVMDTPSWSVSDDVVSLLVRAIDSIKIRNLITTMTAQSAMTSWLSAIEESEWPEGIAIGRECELRSHDEEKAVIRFQRHYLLTDEVRKHITEGKLPEKLAVEWDGRVKFILDDAMRLRKITFLDGVFDDADKDATGFDADVAIFTGEMSKLIPGLVAAMGGELTPETIKAPGVTIYTNGEPDPLLNDAKAMVIADGKASISYVQRKLRIGYNRAARLLEDLEVMGVVSPMSSAGVRDVLVKGGA